jgi:hypothetical protein
MATGRTSVLMLASALTIVPALGQGWVGQQRISHPNGDTSDQQPCVDSDSAGRPWVVWIGGRRDTTMFYSRWDGSHWEPERGVGPNRPGAWSRLKPSLACGATGGAWLVWHNAYEDNTRDIGSSFWADTCWSPEVQVNLPDSTELDFAPKVACGGGEVWCVWYGGPTDMTPYSVFASRWNELTGLWDPDMQVSPVDSTYHWWCDVAVDANGTPHVVWCNSNRRLICYSYYDGSSWRGPTAVNDTVAVGATGWAAPRIIIDNAGILHVCYTGVARGATGRDVFYSRNDGTGWTPSVRVTSDTAHNYNEWYSDIAADRPDNVWVAWDRQGEGPDDFRVYAAHYNGSEWSSEERLDNDDAYYDVSPDVSLGVGDRPWVVWSGTVAGASDDVWSNHQNDTAALRGERAGTLLHSVVIWTAGPTRTPVRIHFRLQRTGPVRLLVRDVLGRNVVVLVDGIESAGDHTVEWNGRPGARRATGAGVYFAVLEEREGRSICKFEVP